MRTPHLDRLIVLAQQRRYEIAAAAHAHAATHPPTGVPVIPADDVHHIAAGAVWEGDEDGQETI